ncbi:MAG TPA: YjbQ family protein [Firmicutes bacterium]|nr:YjbQ family protein [Bacillota bacterium]
MPVYREDFTVESHRSKELLLITDEVEEILRTSGVKEGICLVYTPHTTAAISINEAADPAVRQDMVLGLTRISPSLIQYSHKEGNSPAHLLASLIGPSEAIPVVDGKLDLGVWQGIYFCEFDGPRVRKVYVQVLG